MKKFLRILIALIVIIVAAVLILGVVEPKDVVVQRNTFINAPKEAVFNQVVNFKNWPHWSPWYQMDSNMKITYTGTDGQPGSGYSWVGDDKKTGTGEMSNTAVKDGRMEYGLHFIKPFDSQADGYFTVENADKGMTKVTWSLTMHFKFPMNAMLAFYSSDKMVGGDFERGLANMKKYVEANATAMPSAAITETSYAAHTFAGIRKTVAMADMSKFFMDSYGMLGKTLGNRIMGNAAGLYYSWDTAKHMSDCVAAFPVADSTKAVTGATIITVPASKAYMSVHNGGYNSMMNDHMALMKYVAEKGKKQTLVLEEYVKGPGQEKDSTKWVTNIYYLVQ